MDSALVATRAEPNSNSAKVKQCGSTLAPMLQQCLEATACGYRVDGVRLFGTPKELRNLQDQRGAAVGSEPGASAWGG